MFSFVISIAYSGKGASRLLLSSLAIPEKPSDPISRLPNLSAMTMKIVVGESDRYNVPSDGRRAAGTAIDELQGLR